DPDVGQAGFERFEFAADGRERAAEERVPFDAIVGAFEGGVDGRDERLLELLHPQEHGRVAVDEVDGDGALGGRDAERGQQGQSEEDAGRRGLHGGLLFSFETRCSPTTSQSWTSTRATTRVQPALAPRILYGKAITVKPNGAGNRSRLASFSICAYGCSRPKKCDSQNSTLPASTSLTRTSKARSMPHASMPIMRTPCSTRYFVASRRRPAWRKS